MNEKNKWKQDIKIILFACLIAVGLFIVSHLSEKSSNNSLGDMIFQDSVIGMRFIENGTIYENFLINNFSAHENNSIINITENNSVLFQGDTYWIVLYSETINLQIFHGMRCEVDITTFPLYYGERIVGICGRVNSVKII